MALETHQAMQGRPQSSHMSNAGVVTTGTVSFQNSQSHQPASGEGGSERNYETRTGTSTVVLHEFSGGSRTEGIIFVVFYLDGNTVSDWGYIQLLAADNTVLYEARVTNDNVASSTVDFSSGEGTQTLRGASDNQIACGAWHSIAFVFKNGATGELTGVVDGQSKTYVADGNDVGATSAVAKVKWYTMTRSGAQDMAVDSVYVFGVRTDQASGTILPYAGGIAVPNGHDTDTNFTNESGQTSAAANLWESIDDPASAEVSESTYLQTTTNDALLLMPVDIDAIWPTEDPENIPGITIGGVHKGSSDFNAVRYACKLGGITEYGDDLDLVDGNATYKEWTFPEKPGGGAWTKADAKNAVFGYQTRQI